MNENSLDLVSVFVEEFKYNVINTFDGLGVCEMIFICDDIDAFVLKNARATIDGTAYVDRHILDEYIQTLCGAILNMKGEGIDDG